MKLIILVIFLTVKNGFCQVTDGTSMTTNFSDTNTTTIGQTAVSQTTVGQTTVNRTTSQTNAGQTNAGQTNAGQTNAGQTNTSQTNSSQTNAGRVTNIASTLLPSNATVAIIQMTSLATTKSTTTPLSENPILQSISPDVLRLFLNFYPDYSPERIQIFDKNRTLLFGIFDNKEFGIDCSIGEIYYKILEDEFVKTRNNQVVNDNRLKQVVKCKRDCNFDRLLASNYTTDRANFSKTFMPLVNLAVAPFCRNTLGKFLTPRNSTNATAPLNKDDILSSTGNGQIPLGSIFTPTEIKNIPSGDVLSLITTFKEKIDDTSAQILAKKLSSDTNFTDIVYIAQYARPEIFKNANPSDLVNNVDKFASKIGPDQANVISNKIATSGTASEILTFLNKTDSSFADRIPIHLLTSKGVNIASLPDKSIPTTFRQNLTKSLLGSGTQTINNLDQGTLVTIVSAITRDDIAKVPKDNKFNAILSLLLASGNSSKSLTSSQRASFLDGILEAWSNVNKTKVFDELKTSDVETLAELFVAANSSVFSWLRDTSNFLTVIAKNSKISSAKCCSFLYRSRALYAMEAIKKLVPIVSNIRTTHLESLGPCFASLIPSEYLASLSAENFKAQITYFNTLNFQPNISVYPEIGKKLNILYQNLTTDTDKLSFLSDIGSLFIFMNQTLMNQSSAKSLIKSLASSILYDIKNERETVTEDVQECRLGTGNDQETLALIKSAKQNLVESLFTTTTSRKKRGITSITCNTVNDAIAAIEFVPTSSFTSMDLNEYKACIQILGDINTQLTSDQCKALASKIPIITIPDSDISLYGQILSCYNTSDFANLNITSIASIQAVGQVKTFSAEQKTKIVEVIRKSGIDASKFSVMGNLACGLSQTDLNGITDNDYLNNIKSLSLINDADCPALRILFNKAKPLVNNGILDSVLVSELGSIIGGINETEANTLDTRSIQAMSNNALKVIPATVVNSLSSVQLRAFNSEQLNSLLNSKNSASFSSTTKTLLDNAINNIDVTRTDVINTNNQLIQSGSNADKNKPYVSFIILSLIYFILN